MGNYLERLGSRIRATGSILCLGLDPDPASIPASFGLGLEGVERFTMLLAEAASPWAAAVKPNLAFFEAFGSDGLAVLERICARLDPALPLVADAKRGDIGSTASRQAVALFDRLGADAVTLSPYLGSEAIAPLLARGDRFAYVLCRTSNPGAGELQDLLVTADQDLGYPAEPLHQRVARRAREWSRRFGTVGLVVGATAPSELEALRAIAPDLPFLVPGIGAQGGDLGAALRFGPASDGDAGTVPGGALLVNVSRGIASAALDADDPAEAMAGAARDWAGRLAVLQSGPGSGT